MLLHGLGSAVAQKQFLCRKIQRGHLDVDDRFLTIEVDCLMYRDLSVAQALQLIDVPVVINPDQRQGRDFPGAARNGRPSMWRSL